MAGIVRGGPRCSVGADGVLAWLELAGIAGPSNEAIALVLKARFLAVEPVIVQVSEKARVHETGSAGLIGMNGVRGYAAAAEGAGADRQIEFRVRHGKGLRLSLVQGARLSMGCWKMQRLLHDGRELSAMCGGECLVQSCLARMATGSTAPDCGRFTITKTARRVTASQLLSSTRA